MGEKKVYDNFSTLDEKLNHLAEIHESRKNRRLKARHLSEYEFELLKHSITRLKRKEKNELFKSRNISIANLSGQDQIPETGIEEMVVVDKQLLEFGKSINGGYSKKQRELLGINPPWPPKEMDIKATIGSKISKKRAEKFLSIKNAHLDMKKFKSNIRKAVSWKQSPEKSAKRLGIDVEIYSDIKTQILKERKQNSKSKTRKKINPARRKKPRYSAKFQREAMKLIREGLTGAEISKIMGVNKETIRSWRKKNNLSGQTKTHSITTQNDVLDLIRSGKSNSEISKDTGVSSTTVANWRKKFDKEGF